MKPVLLKWELGRDRYSRRVTLTREGDDYTIEIEPADQRDDGYIIRNLSRAMLLAAAKASEDQR